MNLRASATCAALRARADAGARRPPRSADRSRGRPPGTGSCRCRQDRGRRCGCRWRPASPGRPSPPCRGDQRLLLLERGAVRARIEVAPALELEVALVDRPPARVRERLVAGEHVLRQVGVGAEGRRGRDRVRDQLGHPRRLVAQRDARRAARLDPLAGAQQFAPCPGRRRDARVPRRPCGCRSRRSASRPRSTCTSGRARPAARRMFGAIGSIHRSPERSASTPAEASCCTDIAEPLPGQTTNRSGALPPPICARSDVCRSSTPA